MARTAAAASRGSSNSNINSKSMKGKKKVVESDDEGSSDLESTESAGSEQSEEDDADSEEEKQQQGKKGAKAASRTTAPAKRRVLSDSEDEENRHVVVTSSKSDASSSRKSKSSGESASSAASLGVKAAGLPAQRTVSLNDTVSKRRLSGHGRMNDIISGRVSELRRQSMPNRKSLVGGGPGDSGDSSFASSSGGNNSPAKLGPGQPPVRRTSQGFALQGGGIGALNAANALKRTGTGGSNGSAVLGDVTLPQMPALSKEVMNTNYEEWMKMATDNKINSSNTWSFALIDYFHDMSLLRNADDEGSINFQKASCTLDGCVKIWTSRVDSVATETGKLLNGLSADAAKRGEQADDDEDGEDNEEMGPDGELRPKKKKARSGHTATLAENFSKIAVKDLELEFTVDPLFKKTSADFDEGGAAGLLMNHLGSDSTMRVVFDAGDAKVEDSDDEEEEEDDGLDDDEKLPEVDISRLKAKFLPNVEAIKDMSICPSLSAFKFSSDPTLLDLSLFNRNTLGDSVSGREPSVGGDIAEKGILDDMTYGNALQGGGTQDFFDDDAAAAGGYGDEGDGSFGDQGDGGFGMNVDGDGQDDAAFASGDEGNGGYAPGAGGQHLGAMQRFDPRLSRDEREVVIGMNGEGSDEAADQRQVFSYFDTALAKNWAGPEHWKMRRTIRRAEKEEADAEAAAALEEGGAKGKGRKAKPKEPFVIDFSAEAEIPDSKKIFEQGKASITLPSASKRKRNAEREKREEYLLPDDMHFSSQQLLRLFMKPKASVNMRRRLHRTSAADALRAAEGGNLEVDEHYWAAAAAQAGAAGTGGEVNGEDDDDYGPALPFDTQFFHDDGDTPDFDDDMPMGDDMGGMEAPIGSSGGSGAPEDLKRDEQDDLLAATQTQVKRARPQFVNYAKKAKRVDVKRLKENIWKELAIENMPQRASNTKSAASKDADDDVDEPKEFTSVIFGLRKTYPQEKMEEISTSFCFICLLHLANEQGLQIQDATAESRTAEDNADDEDEDAEGEVREKENNDWMSMETTSRYVGGLEKLRIRRQIMA